MTTNTQPENMNELALFAGAGGGLLGGHQLGWRTVCAVEWNPYAASVLVARQNDRCLPPFPIWDDVQTFDGRPWRGRVDVVSGGFPCQDISVAGKGAGLDGERSGMWHHMARIIREVAPRFVFVENSPALTLRGLDRVLADLAAMGYDAAWGVLGADDAGAPHRRKRIWIVGELANARGQRGQGQRQHLGSLGPRGQGVQDPAPACNDWWHRDPADEPRGSESFVGRVADGVAHRVDRLAAIGNGQVPAVAALAWRTLLTRLRA
jgi:DNA (cytosine-5)-methyltransferase 1